MKTKINRIFTFILTIIIVFTFGANTALASETKSPTYDVIITDDSGVDLIYMNIDLISASITSKGTKVYLSTSVVSKSRNNIKILMCLERLDGTTYKTIADWSNSGTGTTLSVSGSRVYNVLKKYRLRSVVTVGNESVTVYRYL